MSTSNFHNINASKIYACDTADEYAYEDLKMNLEEEIDNLPKGYDVERQCSDELRNYPAHVLGVITDDFEYGETELEIVLRSGYYGGVNIDFNILFEGNVYESIEDILSEYQDTYEYNEEKEGKIHVKDMEDQLEKITKFFNEAVNTFEELAGKWSTPLRVVATFSNGETIYEKIK